jgi:hypothetical protein
VPAWHPPAGAVPGSAHQDVRPDLPDADPSDADPQVPGVPARNHAAAPDLPVAAAQASSRPDADPGKSAGPAKAEPDLAHPGSVHPDAPVRARERLHALPADLLGSGGGVLRYRHAAVQLGARRAVRRADGQVSDPLRAEHFPGADVLAADPEADLPDADPAVWAQSAHPDEHPPDSGRPAVFPAAILGQEPPIAEPRAPVDSEAERAHPVAATAPPVC